MKKIVNSKLKLGNEISSGENVVESHMRAQSDQKWGGTDDKTAE